MKIMIHQNRSIMKQFLRSVLVVAMLVAPFLTRAQSGFSDYTFNVGSTTYTSIVGNGGTSLNLTTDDGYSTLAMPFDFQFGQTLIATGTNIYPGSNGYIVLGGTAGLTNTTINPTTQYNIIHPLAQRDGHTGRNGGGVYYKTEGTAGSRVLTIEYKGYAIYYSSSPYDNVNFQVRLHEQGDIEIIYGSFSVSSSSSGMVFFRENAHTDLMYLSGTWASPSMFTTTSPTTTTAPAITLNSTTYPANGTRYTFSPIPPQCPGPRGLHLTNLTYDTAAFTWTAGGSETQWEIYYTTSATAPTITTPPTISGVTTTSYTLGNLTPNTTYNVYVRSMCSTQAGDTSSWRALSFRTACAPQTIPYIENFDNFSNYGSTGMDLGCMRRASSNTSYPYVNSSHYLSWGSYSGSMYFYNTSSTAYSVLAFPLMNTPVTDLQITFYMMKTSYLSYSGLQVGVMVDPEDNSTFTQIGTAGNPTNTYDFTKFTVSLAGYTGSGKYIALRLPTGNVNNCYVDNVVIDYIPTCPDVTGLAISNITTNSADISWNANGSVTSWEIYRSIDDTTRPAPSTAGQYPSITTNPYRLPALSSDHTYYRWVRSDCGGTKGRWVYAGSVKPHCAALTVTDAVPWVENFDSYNGVCYSCTNGVMPDCWGRYYAWPTYPIGRYSVYAPHVGNYADATGGSRELVMWAYSGSPGSYGYYPCYGNTYAFLPVFSNPLNTLVLSFKAKRYNASYGTLYVGYVTDDDPTTFTQIASYTSIPSDRYESYELNLLNTTFPTGARLAFQYNSSGSTSYYGMIDDVQLRVQDTTADILAMDIHTPAGIQRGTSVIDHTNKTINITVVVDATLSSVVMVSITSP